MDSQLRHSKPARTVPKSYQDVPMADDEFVVDAQLPTNTLLTPRLAKASGSGA